MDFFIPESSGGISERSKIFPKKFGELGKLCYLCIWILLIATRKSTVK